MSVVRCPAGLWRASGHGLTADRQPLVPCPLSPVRGPLRMWKALLVIALVVLFVVGSLMTLKYTANMGLPRLPPKRAEGEHEPEEEDVEKR